MHWFASMLGLGLSIHVALAARFLVQYPYLIFLSSTTLVAFISSHSLWAFQPAAIAQATIQVPTLSCGQVSATHLLKIVDDSTIDEIFARFLSLAGSKLRLCSANHRAGYFSNLACDWLSIDWAYSEQETENGPWSSMCCRDLTQRQITWIIAPAMATRARCLICNKLFLLHRQWPWAIPG